MSLFRAIAYLLLLALVVLVAALAAILYELAAGRPLTPEVRRGLLVLAAVILLALLLFFFFLCLARAKERLRGRRDDYRERARRMAAGDPVHGRIAAADPPRFPQALQSFCDALVRRKFPRPCVQLPVPVTKRPDPCIYSQFFLMAAGQPVTWDNPDVRILLGGVEQDTYNLSASTTYRVEVSLHNASPFFHAPNTGVQVNMLTFGIGAPAPTPLSTTTVAIPAGTPPSPPVVHAFDWTTPAEPGHFCLQVLLSNADDVNPGNNEGWNNTEVHALPPGQEFRRAFPVWNAAPGLKGRERALANERFAAAASEVRLAVDSYLLPSLPADADPDAFFVPRPALWGAAVTPGELRLPPGGAQPGEAVFAVTVPADAAPGTRAVFNVTGTAGGRPLGGVTFYLDVA